MSGTLALRLERMGGAELLATASPTQGSLTIRFTEISRTGPGFAALEGLARGVAQLAPSASEQGRSLRLDDNRLVGTAVAAGASGELVGPVVFTFADASVVSCATARWSLGRVSP